MPTAFPEGSNGIPTALSRYSHAIPILFPWYSHLLSEHSHSIPTALPKYSHGVHIATPWHSHSIEVFPQRSQTVQMLLPQYSSLQSSDSIPMVFARIIPMLFLRFSHALPMPFLEHSHAISSQSRSILMILLAYSHMLFPHPHSNPRVLPCFPPTVFPEHSHSIPTASPKNSHGVPIVLPWYFPQCSQTTPILQGVFSQYSHSVCPVCPWCSHNMLVIFL